MRSNDNAAAPAQLANRPFSPLHCKCTYDGAMTTRQDVSCGLTR